MLGAAHALPSLPRRVLVAGVSGAGKTTPCRRIAATASPRHTEIDRLFHGKGWSVRKEFEADVARFSAAPAWVAEWQYSSARRRLVDRADTLVWLDLPTPLVLARVIRRTVRRRVRREVLWNGNVEPGLWNAFLSPEGIVRWALRTRGKYRQAVPLLATTHPRLTVVRLRSQREVELWLGGPLACAVKPR